MTPLFLQGIEEKDELTGTAAEKTGLLVWGGGCWGEEHGRTFTEKPLALMLPSSYRQHRLQRKARGYRGRDSKIKSFSFLAPGTGSEVLSTEEARSKHPPTSPQPAVKRKAPASGAHRHRLEKQRQWHGGRRGGITGTIWQRRRLPILGMINLKGTQDIPQTGVGGRKATEVKLRNPAFQVTWYHICSPGPRLLPQLCATSRQHTHTPTHTRLGRASDDLV